jgi:hypothetical protein
VHDDHVSLIGHSAKRGSNEEIEIKIQCFGMEFSLSLEQNTDLFTGDSKVLVYGENEVLIDSYTMPRIAYREKLNDEFIARISIFEYDKLKIKGTWVTENETYFIDPVEDHKENIKRLLDNSVSHVIYKESDINQDNGLRSSDGIIPLYKIPKNKRNIQTNVNDSVLVDVNFIPIAQKLEANYPPPAPCPGTKKTVIISSVADHTYTKVTGSQANSRNEIINNINVASALYERTVNIKLQLNVIDIRTASSATPEWNTESCPTIEKKLSQISGWRGSQEQQSALYHLSTNCYPPPGTVGLAWIGVTCIKSSNSDGSGGYFSGTGVSTYLKGSDGYRVTAHEIGHNFNAQHEADGIMKPSLTTIDYFSQVTQNQMCQHIQSSTSKCYQDTTSPTCVPNCSLRNCGSNGCGGTCGSCSSGTVCDASKGTCISSCVPQCYGKTCGSNGCGGTCGSCSSGTICDSNKGTCVSTCVPQCSGKNCGSNGCGGSCGTCQTNYQCNLGVCSAINNPVPSNYKDIILDAHNTLRSKYSIYPIKWDTTLEKVAQTWSSSCVYGNNAVADRLNYGQNFAVGDIGESIPSIINDWKIQENNYACTVNKCYGSCSQFLQMMHQRAAFVGCALNTCKVPRTGVAYTGPWNHFVCYYYIKSSLVSSIPTSNCMGRSCVSNSTCASQEIACGYTNDGCDTIYCGECPVGSKCDKGFCKCTPFTDCKLSNKTCGKLFDGCNSIDCGSCSGDETCSEVGVCKKPSPCNSCKDYYKCVNDQCVCTPTKTCPKNSCGKMFNGCDYVECGACSSSSQCINFTCSSCSNCHMMAKCVASTCQCLPGYIGDGTRCIKTSDNPPSTITDWNVVEGADWLIQYNAFDKKNELSCSSDGSNAIAWRTTNVFSKANVTFSVDVIPQEGAMEWGLIFRQNGGKYLKFTYKNQKFYRGIKQNYLLKEYEFPTSQEWTKNTVKKLSVVSDGKYHQFLVNDQLLSTKYWLVDHYDIGNVGLYSDGPVSFENVVIRTSTIININLQKCLSSAAIKSSLQKILSLNEEDIGNIEIKCSTKKRDVSSAASATLTLFGNAESSSTSMVSELTGRGLSSHLSMESNFFSFEEPIVSSVSPSPSMLLEPIAPSSIAALSTNAIIGITAGAVAAALIIAGIIAIIWKRKSVKAVAPKIPDEKTKTFDLEERQGDLNKIEQTGISVDPFNPDPRGFHSITARTMKY